MSPTGLEARAPRSLQPILVHTPRTRKKLMGDHDASEDGDGEEKQPEAALRRGPTLASRKATAGGNERAPDKGARVDAAADDSLPDCCAEHQERG
eukprot:1983587-Amphidinium_carterae.1